MCRRTEGTSTTARRLLWRFSWFRCRIIYHNVVQTARVWIILTLIFIKYWKKKLSNKSYNLNDIGRKPVFTYAVSVFSSTASVNSDTKLPTYLLIYCALKYSYLLTYCSSSSSIVAVFTLVSVDERVARCTLTSQQRRRVKLSRVTNNSPASRLPVRTPCD